MDNFKNINIGELIRLRVKECNIDTLRICNFLSCSDKEVTEMYDAKSIDSEILLRMSKLLEYDFFRVYTQHLILYAPQSEKYCYKTEQKNKSKLPQFRKNIYTNAIIEFILGRIERGEITKEQVTKIYNIPKTTLYRWISKTKDFMVK